MPPASVEVDATGLACPMPVIELSAALDRVEVGEVVHLLATDPTARVDVPVWCRLRRHRLLSTDEADDRLGFWVQRRH